MEDMLQENLTKELAHGRVTRNTEYVTNIERAFKAEGRAVPDTTGREAYLGGVGRLDDISKGAA